VPVAGALLGRVGAVLHGAVDLLHRGGGLLQAAGLRLGAARTGPGCRLAIWATADATSTSVRTSAPRCAGSPPAAVQRLLHSPGAPLAPVTACVRSPAARWLASATRRCTGASPGARVASTVGDDQPDTATATVRRRPGRPGRAPPVATAPSNCTAQQAGVRAGPGSASEPGRARCAARRPAFSCMLQPGLVRLRHAWWRTALRRPAPRRLGSVRTDR
jgi:hypothetical protein